MSDADAAKINAARGALEFVRPGMIVGLGTGSTAAHFVRLLAAQGAKNTCVATSVATHELAQQLGLNVVSPDDVSTIDVTVDGADEIDPQFRLIKGGGAALLREKIIAASSKAMVVITDASKCVDTLGKFPLPVEITQFGRGLTTRKVEAALAAGQTRGKAVLLREKGGKPVITDGGNFILDCRCEQIGAPEALAAALSNIPGVVEHGLFIGIASAAVIGNENGAQTLRRSV
jgi:ribose 5-phosphate isomerase A